MKRVIIGIIKFYQKYISRYFGANCRFYPSCSHYCIQAIDKYGIIKGSYLGLKRILKCNPFNQGGIDYLE